MTASAKRSCNPSLAEQVSVAGEPTRLRLVGAEGLTSVSVEGGFTLPPAALEAIAARVVELLVERAAPVEDRWMGTQEAAAYLGMTPNALHKLTAAREIPFSQDVPGGRCWFLRSELDDWRRGPRG